MRTVLKQLGRVLPAGSAFLLLAACGSTPAPTATEAVAATSATAAGQPSSVIVSGLVVDSSNRPLASAIVECMGNLQCTGIGEVAAQDGGDFNVKTDANGFYKLIVTGRGAGNFLGASAKGYQVAWRALQLPDPACTSDQPGCAVSVNFTLTPQV